MFGKNRPEARRDGGTEGGRGDFSHKGRQEEERGRDDSKEKEIGSDQNSRSWILNTQLLLIGY